MDAVILANTLYAHVLDPSRDIEAGLRSYEAERRDNAKGAVNNTCVFWRLLSRQGRIGVLVRYLVLNHVPQFLLNWLGDRVNYYRPQAVFLPRALRVGPHPTTTRRSMLFYLTGNRWRSMYLNDQESRGQTE